MSASPKKAANADQVKNPGRKPGRPTKRAIDPVEESLPATTPTAEAAQATETPNRRPSSSRSKEKSAERRPEWVRDFLESQSQGFKAFESSPVSAITARFKAQAEREDHYYEMEEGDESDENPDLCSTQYQAKRMCPYPESGSESADPMDALVGGQQDSPATTSDEDLLQEWICLDQVDESVTDPVVEGLATLLNAILKTGPHKEKEKGSTRKNF